MKTEENLLLTITGCRVFAFLKYDKGPRGELSITNYNNNNNNNNSNNNLIFEGDI